MLHHKEKREPHDSPGGCLAEAGIEVMQFAAELPELFGVPLFVVIAFVFVMAWLLRWVVDEMISRG